ncbi:hypothetical protein IGI04_037450 [Brassica rapa subsp. trilocularis]|uniref:Glycosyltransferase n=1 Tax=Brassica rapa subsp. trilocularis TaxID=1813537 RepID=A0ABQ7LHC8_BRACM|nr:hypothetical protein IGI04_037450 [Brassica rapa subsp. trilocularis]
MYIIHILADCVCILYMLSFIFKHLIHPKMETKMVSKSRRLHFILIPLMAQGHLIPMVDISKILAEQGNIITIVSTPQNASRFAKTVERAKSESGFQINVVTFPIAYKEFGLPENCETLDTLPSKDLLRKFYDAVDKIQEPLERFLEEQETPPSCIISDKCLFWTSKTAKRFKIPRVVFHGMCCFSLLSSHNVHLHSPHLSVSSDSEPFSIPEMPHKVEIAGSQLPGAFRKLENMDDVREKMRESESEAFGVIVNSFHKLEPGYAEAYAKAIKKKRIRGRGIVIKGWSPQAMILSHGSTGGFLTHCGWNSASEGVSFGVPMITWPMFAEQFLNEKLVVEVLKVGVRVGVEIPVRWGDEERVGVLVKKHSVVKAIKLLMDEDGNEDGEFLGRRIRVQELAVKAREAVEMKGSSSTNVSLFIQDVLEKLKLLYSIELFSSSQVNSFNLLSSHNLHLHSPHLSVSSDSEPFTIPAMPHRVQIARSQLSGAFRKQANRDDVRREKMRESEAEAFGVIVNSFQELEPGYGEAYAEAIKKKVWFVGPVSLCNDRMVDLFEATTVTWRLVRPHA